MSMSLGRPVKRRQKIALGVLLGIPGLWGALRFLFEGWYVNGNAMAPSYHHGDLLLGYKLAYATASDVHRGDVVVVRHSEDGVDGHEVWRVAGTPGDEYPRADGSSSHLRTDEFFLRGDNPLALDGRTFGALPFKQIQFKIIARLTLASQ
jgi:signal peptidase I